MSSSDDADGNAPAAAPSTKWDAVMTTIRATAGLLIFAFVCFGSLFGIWYFDVTVPWRGLALTFMVLCIAGPFAVSYCLIAAWIYLRNSMTPVMIVDPEHKEFHVRELRPSRFAEYEVVGGELAYRQTSSGRIWICTDMRTEQRERTTESGEIETYGQPVMEVNWEGMIDELDFIETVLALQEVKDELVPLAIEGLKARAGRDIDTLKNTDRFSLGLLTGAERDVFFDDADGTAFDWDLNGGVDIDEMMDAAGDDLDGLDDDHADGLDDDLDGDQEAGADE